MVGRFFTGLSWGVIADKYGRKAVMYAGILSVIVFNTGFGLSNGFWMAVVTRFLLGIFNGMLGTLQAYATEICSEEHQPLGLSVVSTLWGLGLIIGPALGGYLSQPAIKYPNIFKNSLFDRFPYFLPCLCITIFAVVTLAITFVLPETWHNHETTHAKSSNDNGSDIKSQSRDATPSAVESGLATTENAPKKKTLLKNRPLLASVAVFCIWSMHDIAYTEIFSLWALSPTSLGGLSLRSTDVGNVFAVSGFCMLVFQLSLFPRFTHRLGPIIVVRIAAILTVPLLAACSYFSLLSKLWLWVAILPTNIFKNIFSVSITTGSFLLINNSVTHDQRGAANGISMSMVSLFKAVGPAGGGALFAWSQTRTQASFLPGVQLVFFCLNIIAIITIVATFEPFLPKSTNRPIQDKIIITGRLVDGEGEINKRGDVSQKRENEPSSPRKGERH
ncbi:hypothetical protein O6H91_Y582400 [Diphasiastrum complanatum]|nr:hypothetical protein O6H91_Y582400 [Diphasiastrum complanatum]